MSFTTPLQKQSYALGTDVANQFMAQEIELDGEALAAGILDTVQGKDLQLTTDEIRGALQTLVDQQRQRQAAMQQAAQAQAEENLKAGEAFLAENAKRDEVVVLDSGLQYEVISEGTGEKPARENTVEVHYRGTLINGQEFDSSYSRNQPAQFGVTQVIAGWTEGLQLMPEGAKWKFYIPSNLAYGERAMGPQLPAHSTLIFEVELLQANV